MNLVKNIFRKISGIFVNGIGGKILNSLSFKLYMKKKKKWLSKMGVKIEGAPTYISPDAYFDSHNYSIIKICNNVTISREVMLLTHDYSLSSAMNGIGKSEVMGGGKYSSHC